ncbi:MAG: 30S ribosomal protein S5 [Candidatus Diapherotrites archaeon]|uniref:30S ribosomal protein S5 n=1 Tax=Candidatus Iainarchaeum sp. TaxID=3101447 RepID=A0A2D6M0P5_9ARCH|nr:30S ribosomal protein S5 [Candidatus Diapherotrites archaeon]
MDPELRASRAAEEKEKELTAWIPKTRLGKKVKAGEITSIEEIFKENTPVQEPEIIDILLNLEETVVDVKKTTRVVRAGRKFSFRVAVLVGNKNGVIGLGTAKDAEKWPAVKKAARKAKLNLVQIARSCGSWECTCSIQHSVPFRVSGKNAAARITLLPAPRGVGLVVGDNIKDVLRFAGVSDVWCKVTGATSTKLNFIRATIDALSKTTKMKASNAITKKMERR